jgi:hypothetical protein
LNTPKTQGGCQSPNWTAGADLASRQPLPPLGASTRRRDWPPARSTRFGDWRPVRACVTVVILFEKQAIAPVRVFLELPVLSETSSPALRITGENADHAVGDLLERTGSAAHGVQPRQQSIRFVNKRTKWAKGPHATGVSSGGRHLSQTRLTEGGLLCSRLPLRQVTR